jgi:YihY family inner membrane protein
MEQSAWKRCGETSWKAVRIFTQIEGELRAAAFAYYALFSLIPLFTLLLTLGSVFVDSSDIIDTVEKFFPMGESEQGFVWQMAESLQKARGGVSALSVLVLLWSSIRFFQALVQGVNRAWHRVEIPWWKLPLKNLLMMAVLASALGIGLIAPAFLQAAMKILAALEGFLNEQIPGLHFSALTLVFNGSRYIVAGGLMFYALSALYMLAPGRRIYFQQVWRSALIVSIALQIGQSIFGNYVAKIVNFNAIYGSVGALMLALMWVYIAGVLILFGSCFCAAAASGQNATTPTNSSH